MTRHAATTAVRTPTAPEAFRRGLARPTLVGLTLSLALSLTGCVRASLFSSDGLAPRARASQGARLGMAPWIGVASQGWASRWVPGATGELTRVWEQDMAWPVGHETGVVWIGVGKTAECTATGQLETMLLSEGQAITRGAPVGTLREKRREAWAARTLEMRGWSAAWRPVWVLETTPPLPTRLRWQADAASSASPPCVAGWVGVPADDYWVAAAS
jgi:hypothetical protein